MEKSKKVNIVFKSNSGVCWEAFPNSGRRVKMNQISSGNQDQDWEITGITGGKLKVNTRTYGDKVAECYANNGSRIETSNDKPDNKDQIFGLEQVSGKGENVYRIYCKTKNGGILYAKGNSKNNIDITLQKANPSDDEMLWIIK